jgi:ABC-type dipeptide/oligopeptide/nickel transport system ATPase subunit
VLELLDMSLSGIGRFVEEQSIDFSSLDQFIQVDARNNNTGGSSGSGKTTAFNALDFLLGLNDLPATILQSRYTDDHINVHGNFLWNGKKVYIARGKKLKVQIGEKVYEGSSSLAEEQIDAILGMPRKIFRKLLHKRQKEGGFFLDFTPAKMHEFLIDCLNLTEFRLKDKLVDALIDGLFEKKTKEESFLNGQEVGLDATVAAIVSLGAPPVKQMDQETILGLKKKVDEAESQLKSLTGVWSTVLRDLENERPIIQVVPFDRSEIDKCAGVILVLNNILNGLFQEDKDRVAKVRESIVKNKQAKKDAEAAVVLAHAAKLETVKLAEEIKKIRASICPTCEQSWITEQYSTQERERLTQILRLKAVMDAGDKARGDLVLLGDEALYLQSQDQGKVHPDMPGINEKLREAHARHLEEKLKGDAWIEKQNLANKQENEKFTQKQKDVQFRAESEINQARGTLDIARRVFDNAVNILRSHSEASANHERNLKSLKEKEEKFTSKIAEVKTTISAIDAELILAQETKKAIKKFLSYSFDHAIDSIGRRATEIIRCIPNMSNATIQFDGAKETADGKVKDEVNAVIGMDGEEGVPIKSLSGGERSSLDIAVDLAVIDFIETKSGKGMNLFILDEPFTGLGPVEIEMALEVLKNSNTNKKIVIVDHNSEVKQMVQNRLVVVRDGLTSKIEKEA